MKHILLAILLLSTLGANAQFTGTDSLRNYNNRYITTNPATAFTNNRLNTLLRGIIDFIDTARAGSGGAVNLGIDTVFAVNDSTIRYRKNGVFRQFTLKGVYDSRRKVDTIYKSDDTTLTYTVNGSPRTMTIPGGTNVNLATANQTATGNRIHNWDDFWLYLYNIKSFDITTDHADPNHLNNRYRFELFSDSTVDGIPVKMFWGLRNIDDDLTDSVHFELSSTSTATTIYHHALDSTKVVKLDLNAGATTPDFHVTVSNVSKSSSFRFGETTTLNPADSLALKAIPAANADSLLAVRAVNGSVNTAIKIPASAIRGRFGLEDATTSSNRSFNFNNFTFEADSFSNYNLYSKAQSSGVDRGVVGQFRSSPTSSYLWHYSTVPGSTRSYGINAYGALTQIFAAGHVPGHATYGQFDTLQVILEADPNRLYMFHDSVSLQNITGGNMDFRIRTLPETIDTSYKSLVSGPKGQVFLRAGGNGGGGGTPGGSNTQVQYNNSGSFAGDGGMTYNATNNTLSTDSINNLQSTIGGSKPITGVIQQDFFRDRTTLGYQYTSVLPNATVTLDGNKMTVSGGVGNSANHITREYWRGSESWSDTLTATVGTINSSSNGLIYSQIGTNFSNHTIFYMANDGSGYFGHIQLETSLGSVLTASSGAVTLSTGDSIVMIISRSHDVWSATWNDITSSTSCTVSYTFSYSSGANTFHNAYRNRLYLYGGTQYIGSWKMGSGVLKNIPVIGIGNSIMAGHFAGSLNGRYMNQVFGNDYTLFDINAGPSDRIADVINKLPSILASNPIYAFIDIGTNDAGAGMTIAQFQAAYTDMISRFISAGVRVVVGAITPRNSMDVTPYNSVIQKIAGLYGITYIDLYTPLKGAGTGLSATYDDGDGLHINSAGNTLMASTITAGAPELLTAGKSYTVQANNAPSFFNNRAIFNGASFNQSATYNVDLPIEDSTQQLVTTGWFKRAINSNSSVGFIKNQFTSAQSGSAWIDGTFKALKFSLTSGVYLSATSGEANAIDARPGLRATANSDVLSTLTINPTFDDNSFSGVSHYGLQILNGDALFANGMLFNKLSTLSRVLTTTDHYNQSNSTGSGTQFNFWNAVTSGGFSGTVLKINGSGTNSSGTMLKVLGVSDAELFNVKASGNTLVGTDTDNSLAKLQVNGKVSIATVDSTATAPNMLYQDPASGLIKKTAAPAVTLKGTLNWTPGSVGAGSSTSTTVSITGAVGGDGVVVTKVSGGYSNGEIYDAWVSAPGVVTVRVHNVSGGSANYSTATDYNVIVIKY
jgi:lysophospholipase L1-like esterase